ncbi:Cell division control protein 11 [Dictyocoela muelleri]|nr:Cell division control protein 11 [Dictyocoela muelleri]
MGRRRKYEFTVMLAGHSGCGKSSFINTLFKKDIVEVNRREKSMDIDVYLMDVDCEGLRKKITIVDTPGFGCTLDDSIIYENILSYLKSQFDLYLAEETKIRRNHNYEDTRVHTLLFFISPTGLKSSDITFLKKIKDMVNIVPVIAKADTLTNNELLEFRRNVMRKFNENEIIVFNFSSDGINSEILSDLSEKMPFTIISDDWTECKDGIPTPRKYHWSVPDPNDSKHCDFSLLKEILFSVCTESLVEYTENEIYENYRTGVLTSLIPEK